MSFPLLSLNGPQAIFEYQTTNNPSSSSPSTTSLDAPNLAPKRVKTLSNPTMPFCLGKNPLNSVSVIHAFNFLSFEELMRTKPTCQLINRVVADQAVTEYILTHVQKKFTNEILKKCLSISNPRRISLIDLSNTRISDFALIADCSLPALRTLKLPSTCQNISREQLLSFSQKNPQIQRLSLNRCGAEDIFSSLKFNELLELELEGAVEEMSIEKAVLLSEAHPNLQKLSLKVLQGENVIPHLKFSKLRELNLNKADALVSMNSLEKQEEISALSTNCPLLTSLFLSNAPYGATFLDLSKLNFSLMEHLDISNWSTPEGDDTFRYRGLSSLVQHSPSLRSLNLSGFDMNKEELALLHQWKLLTTLSLSRSGIDNENFSALCTSNPQLTSLDLSCNMDLEGKALAVGTFPALTYLDFSRCGQISKEESVSISKIYPKLKVLNLSEAALTEHNLEGLALADLTALNIFDILVLPDSLLRLQNRCPKLKNLQHRNPINGDMSRGRHTALPFNQEVFNH